MVRILAEQAKKAARTLALSETEPRNDALLRIATDLWAQRDEILQANARDLESARTAGLAPALLDRLTLTEARLHGVLEDLRSVAALPDPVAEIFEADALPNGLRIQKRRVPLGVLAVIYEARPNVTVDVCGLALKTGNAVILRGGSETLQTNAALVRGIRQTLAACGLPPEAVQFIDDPNRAHVTELLRLHDLIDLLIPRGGAALHAFCRENSQIPVITGGIGICHLFVERSANLDAALPVIFNAKVQRPTVCNALDTLLVDAAIAPEFLPRVVAHLASAGVTFRADGRALPLVAGLPGVLPAGEADFDTEWLSLVLGLKVVDNLDEAIAHIMAHSTGHSDGILTENEGLAARFVREVDSAAVYVNASTRFTDGGQLGLGAEVAISTQRLHARGPMGLRELMTYKWVVQGDYTVRA
ncbi:MAG: glutamate-5-semialdehyde dehydrogenase [Anaerolineales bacterium]